MSSSVVQYIDGFGDVAIPGPQGIQGIQGPKGDVGDVTAEAQEAATQAASSAASSASSASAAQTAAAASAASAQDAEAAAGDVTATVEAQRLEKIVPGTTNPMATLPDVIPPAGTRFITQAGSVTATTNEAGSFSFKWPEAFPTAILSVQLTSGNRDLHNGAISLRDSTGLAVCNATAPGRVSGVVRCDFIVIGY